MNRSRERRSGTPEEKAQLLEQYRAHKEPHYATIRASKKEAEGARCALMSCVPVVQTEILQTEMLPPEMIAEKKDPVAGYPKLSQEGLPPPLILNLQRDKDRVRMSRSREQRSGALEGKAQLPPNSILNYIRGVPLSGKVSL